jgi:hypothetical protein
MAAAQCLLFSRMSGGPTKRVVTLCNFEAEAVDWLWPGRIAAGKLTLIDGDPDQGKSLLTLDLGARLTTASPLPDGTQVAQPMSVVLVGSQDGIRDTILPRLRAAGADLSRVHAFIGMSQDGIEVPPLFPAQVGLLGETLVETGSRLVVIDPLLEVLGAGSINGPAVQAALTPLASLAARTRAAVIMVRHLSKAGRGQKALYRGGGSIAIIGAARTAFLVGSHPDDDQLRVLACTRNALCEFPPALGFRVAVNERNEPVLTWSGPVDLSADQLVLASAPPGGEALRQAQAFLEECLRAGPRPSGAVYREAQAMGIARRTLERAKSDSEVKSKWENSGGERHWCWELKASAGNENSLSWPEDQKRALEQAQKESDEFMAKLREKFGNKRVDSSQ